MLLALPQTLHLPFQQIGQPLASSPKEGQMGIAENKQFVSDLKRAAFFHPAADRDMEHPIVTIWLLLSAQDRAQQTQHPFQESSSQGWDISGFPSPAAALALR